MRNFKKEHFATLTKYLWISFITWWISHWFFTWKRQILTVFIWVILFVIWTLLLKDKKEYSNIKMLFIATIFAISLWAFTWWMQHFLDSPERSLIIVPLGAIISIFAFFYLEWENLFQKKYLSYFIIFSIFIFTLTLSFYWLTEFWFFWQHSH